MSELSQSSIDYVIGPLGGALRLEDLPPSNTRWVARKKAEVVAAVEGGLLTADEACRRYNLSEEELAIWCKAVALGGLPGLRATKIHEYRQHRYLG